MTVPANDAAWMLDVLGHWAERRWLRPLDVALSRFIAGIAPASDGPTLLAVALTAHLEGLGHTCLVVADLLERDGPELSWPVEAGDALRHLLLDLPTSEAAWSAAFAASGAVRIVSQDASDQHGNQPFVLDHGRLYLRRYWRHEHRIARAVIARAAVALPVDEASARRWIDRLFDRREDTAVDWQKIACAVALRSRIAIVTGGPGTGKTFTAVRILAALLATGDGTMRIALAAPTGKAAARLRESIAAAVEPLAARLGDAFALGPAFERIAPARTLHALLGVRRGTRRFRHDAANPLDVDVLLVDEASMIHVEMMDAVLDALPATARLVLIGDENQLASVEAGAVLGELCGDRNDRSDRYAVETVRYVETTTGERVAPSPDRVEPALAQRIVRLQRSERFGATLDRLARAVRAGRADDAEAMLRQADPLDLAWRQAPTPSDVVDLACGGYADFLALVGEAPRSLLAEDHARWIAAVLGAFERFRVLTPLRAGPWGVEGINQAIEARLQRGGWFVGRPLIVTRNEPDVGLFNGDVGVVLPASGGDPRLRAWFADVSGVGSGAGSRAESGAGVRSLSIGRLPAVETAFAMTVHRAQGSEFERVALVVPPHAERVLTRELLYTGITRARRALTIVSADAGAFAAGIARTTRRSSGLAAMLRSRDEGL